MAATNRCFLDGCGCGLNCVSFLCSCRFSGCGFGKWEDRKEGLGSSIEGAGTDTVASSGCVESVAEEFWRSGIVSMT
jgi:hypothetical protein